ncbi:NlpC/P60 family protein [Streptomyces sp. NPDC046821]|uniref:C40 family peptidase n=1 Tax=Streptomyces sp. NPDC046821 TaxID=3154702 RepID=UPI0033C5ED27
MAAAHRKPRPRSLTGPTARTAATLALASAATATAFDGAAHAEPRLTPGQVKAKVDRLYQEAEKATEKYNGAKEKAAKAERQLDALRDESARRMDRLNARREALGSAAAAQYRTGALDPTIQLVLSSDPAHYLDDAALTDRLGTRQAAAVERVRRELRQIGQLRGEADGRLAELRQRQGELRKQKKTVTGKLTEAKRLLDQLPAAERTSIGAGAGDTGTDGTVRASRSDLSRDLPSGALPKAPDSRAAAAIAYAYKALGSPYVWGATGPNAFDCSGLTQAAYRSAGVSLPRTTYSQINAGPRIPRSQLQPGDLVFFYSGISHVGLYIGDGKMIHAPNPSAPVRIASVDLMPFAGATRVA